MKPITWKLVIWKSEHSCSPIKFSHKSTLKFLFFNSFSNELTSQKNNLAKRFNTFLFRHRMIYQILLAIFILILCKKLLSLSYPNMFFCFRLWIQASCENLKFIPYYWVKDRKIPSELFLSIISSKCKNILEQVSWKKNMSTTLVLLYRIPFTYLYTLIPFVNAECRKIW